MFNKDFYPTPEHVAELMDIDCYGKTILEPSAGSGALIDYLKDKGAKKVLACEIDDRLSHITKGKADEFITNDFLAVVAEQVGHIDMMVMNPSFSSASDHIIHAWEIAPEGCEITSLCNWDSLDHGIRGKYMQLKVLVRDYGYKLNLGAVFNQEAERKTDTQIGLIKLYKPVISESDMFEDFYMEDDQEETEYGLMPANEIYRIVGNYKAALQKVDAVFESSRQLEPYTSFFKTGEVGIQMTRSDGKQETVIDKQRFAITLQKTAWKHILSMLNMEQYVSSQVKKDIDAFCERQTHIPFTVRNVRKMFEILIGTQDQIFDRSLVEAVDHFTKYTHENRYGLPGWKTNAGHLLNKKFIINHIVEYKDWNKSFSLCYRRSEHIDDLNKVLCRLTNTRFSEIGSASNFFYQNNIQRGQWYDWAFFQIKCFYKGTVHLKFKDSKHWELLNRKYAEIKGQVLPERM